MELNKKAFTLIELLVAVLIIGILAAIAVSQYNKAVWNTRFMGAYSLTKQFIKAQQLFYLENATFSTNVAELDISFPMQQEDILQCWVQTATSVRCWLEIKTAPILWEMQFINSSGQYELAGEVRPEKNYTFYARQFLLKQGGTLTATNPYFYYHIPTP